MSRSSRTWGLCASTTLPFLVTACNTAEVASADGVMPVVIQYAGFPSLTFDGQTSVYHEFGLPQITPSGHILFSATLSTDPANDVLFDTRDSIWTTTAADPTTFQLQAAYGLPAPTDDWMGAPSPRDAPVPLFNGWREQSNRLRAAGVFDDGSVIFSGGRFGEAQTETGTGWGQADRNFLWQANGGVAQKFVGFDPMATIDFEYASPDGRVAMVVSSGGSDTLYINNTSVAEQNGPDNVVFGNGFGLQGGYQFTTGGDLAFQSVAEVQGSPASWGIYFANPQGVFKVIAEGESYMLPDGGSAQLTQLDTPTFNGYGLQATTTNEVAFIGDGSILIGDEVSTRAVLTPGDRSAMIGGVSKPVVRFFDVTDVLIGPDNTIYFEAEAEIREIGQLGISKNYLWKMTEGGVPEALVAQGGVAIVVGDPDAPGNIVDDIVFDDQFTMKDANADGTLIALARLDRDHSQVTNASDDTLLVFANGGAPEVVARQGDPMPTLPGSFYGLPDAARGAALNDNGELVFLSNAFFSSDPLGAVMFARTSCGSPWVEVATGEAATPETVDFSWQGASCGVTNWHEGEWPGDDAGTETATIGADDVVLADAPVHLKSVTSGGALEVFNQLTLKENSSIATLNLKHNLEIDSRLDIGGGEWTTGRISETGDISVASTNSNIVVAEGGSFAIKPGGVKTLDTNLFNHGPCDRKA